MLKDPVQDTFLDKLIALILKNLQVTITNIHIRYEYDVTNPEKPFSMGITLHELSLLVSLLAYFISLFIRLFVVSILHVLSDFLA